MSHIALYLNCFLSLQFLHESCWVRNAVCLRTSTRAVGPFSLRLVLQFSTSESCYILFTFSLGYLNVYLYCFCPRKIQNWGLSGGIRGYLNPILSHFCLFSDFFCLLLQFSTLELCYIWLVTSLPYIRIYVYCGCPGKI